MKTTAKQALRKVYFFFLQNLFLTIFVSAYKFEKTKCNMNTHFATAKTLWEKSEYRLAIEEFRKASEIYLNENALEDYGQSIVYMATCHYMLQEYDFAIVLFKKRLENILAQDETKIEI